MGFYFKESVLSVVSSMIRQEAVSAQVKKKNILEVKNIAKQGSAGEL